ncbi:MAG TPA: ABC transporter substrate-binding protein [Rhodocyclaceae bacterium]|nr:ABC transporter substrate-binding protein [Rhodocyclaceae bacterium]
MGKLLFILATVLGAALSLPAAGQDNAPDVLVKTVTNDVLAIVREDKDIQSGSTKRAIELVEQKVLPHFNFTRMTQLAVGRDWRQASPEQQSKLVAEFKDLLVRTYSNALTGYRNQVISFKPARYQPADTDVIVRTEVKQPGAQPVSIDYSLRKEADGWKVYDVVVANVSLVTNYRESFAAEVRSGGIDGLIKALQNRNKSLEAKAGEKS